MNIHLGTFLFQIVNFAVVAFVLHRVLYRPLHEAIDRRRQATEKAQADADRAKRDAEALQARLDGERVDAQRQREALLREAHQQAEAEGQRLLADARRRAQEQTAEHCQQLAHEREEALSSLKQELVREAVVLAERFLKQAADRTLHRQLVGRLVDSLASASAQDRQKMSLDWSPADGAVMETAEELDRQSVAQLSTAVSDLVGRQVDLKIKHNPALICGVCLRLGGQVWDASIRGPLPETKGDELAEVAHA